MDNSASSGTEFHGFETPRLKMRRFEARDKPLLLAYRNDPDIARYQSWVNFTEEEAAHFIEEMGVLPLGLPGQGLQIAIEHKEDGDLIGDCYLQVDEQENRQGEIGFTLSRRYQGQGLAAEAVSAVIDDAFRHLNLHRIVAVTDCRNTSSVALLEHLGFRREGHFLKNVWFKGAWGDEYLYAVLREEWQKRSTN